MEIITKRWNNDYFEKYESNYNKDSLFLLAPGDNGSNCERFIFSFNPCKLILSSLFEFSVYKNKVNIDV